MGGDAWDRDLSRVLVPLMLNGLASGYRRIAPDRAFDAHVEISAVDGTDFDDLVDTIRASVLRPARLQISRHRTTGVISDVDRAAAVYLLDAASAYARGVARGRDEASNGADCPYGHGRITLRRAWFDGFSQGRQRSAAKGSPTPRSFRR